MHLRIEMRKVFNGALMEPTPVTVKQINERKVRDTEICEYPYHYIVNFWKLKMVPKFFQGNIEEKLHLYASEKVFKRNLGYIPPSGRRKLAISADFMRDEIKKESEKIHQNNKYLEINNQIMNQELAIEHEITSSTGNKLKCYRFSDLSNSPIAGFIYLIKVFHRYLEDEKMRSKTEEEIEKECWVFIEKFKNVRSSETLPHTLFEGNKNNRVYIEKGKDIWISIIKKVRISTDNSRFMVTGAWMLLKLFFLGDHRLSSIMYPERYMEYKFHFTTLLNEAAYFESLKKHIFPSS
ncbi:hypothetical protein BY996DRAFT_799750 [Phakopsora pachyrhizi]|nr:hypothetical protein BY996DRAFT_799750 [Phakopsora pachyrhizi]